MYGRAGFDLLRLRVLRVHSISSQLPKRYHSVKHVRKKGLRFLGVPQKQIVGHHLGYGATNQIRNKPLWFVANKSGGKTFMNAELPNVEKRSMQRHLAIVAVLLLLLIGPIFGPITQFLGDQFDIETAVFIMLIAFIVGFGIILAVIFRFSEIKSTSLREQLSRLGWGRPSRLGANIVAVLVGLAWGALFLTSILQFQPETNIAELSLVRLAAVLLAVLGTILEDLITRGYVMNGLRQINVPSWGQLVLSALLFTIYHTVWSFNIGSFIFSLILGLILSGLFLWGKRSLTPVIIAHSLTVIIAEPFSSMLIFLAPGA